MNLSLSEFRILIVAWFRLLLLWFRLSFSGRTDSGGKELGCSGARIWVGWSCLIGAWEWGEKGTGFLLTACVRVRGRWGAVDGLGPRGGPASLTLKLYQGHISGVDARISGPFSEIKLPAPSSWGIIVGENKCLDQSTVLMHEGEDDARGIFYSVLL